MVSRSETSCMKGSDGDTRSGEMSTDNEMPPMCGDSEVVNRVAVVECKCKALSDGGISGLGHKTAWCPFMT